MWSFLELSCLFLSCMSLINLLLLRWVGVFCLWCVFVSVWCVFCCCCVIIWGGVFCFGSRGSVVFNCWRWFVSI